jgi:hypothetical protein
MKFKMPKNPTDCIMVTQCRQQLAIAGISSHEIHRSKNEDQDSHNWSKNIISRMIKISTAFFDGFLGVIPLQLFPLFGINSIPQGTVRQELIQEPNVRPMYMLFRMIVQQKLMLRYLEP